MSYPTSEHALLIAALYKRRPTTHWSPKEIKQIKVLEKEGCFKTLDELQLIIRYYAFERAKKKDGIDRRNLDTFLNQYRGERDRALLWAEKYPKLAYPKPKRLLVLHDERPDPGQQAANWDEAAAKRTKEALANFRRTLQQPI